MVVKLVVIGGKHAGQEVPVRGPRFMIGRAADCQLRVKSQAVSRHHTLVVVEAGAVRVRDCSKFGTLVNGQKIEDEQELRNCDRLKVGPLEFEVQLSVDVGGKKLPKVKSVSEAAARVTEKTEDDDDLDISKWLDEGDEELPPTSATGDTQPLNAAHVTETQVGDSPPAGDRSESLQEKGDEKPKQERHGQHGLPSRKKIPTSRDSGAAAEERLRRFFRR